MSLFTCALVGDESLTIACGERLIERGVVIRAVATRDAAVRDWAVGAGLPVAGDLADLPDLAPGGVDWLLSAANLRIVPKALLDWPARGAINFHDGPLPDLAGVNAPVWAILEARPQHGVTWHHMTGSVDAGDILVARRFDMPPEATAHGLNARCYAEALDSFGEVIEELSGPSPRRTVQDAPGPECRHYKRSDLPPHAGQIDLGGSANTAIAVVRALDFGAHANPLAAAKLTIHGTALQVRGAERADGQGAAGTVLEVGDDWLRVMAADGALRLTGLRRMDGRRPDLTLAPGDVLKRPETPAEVLDTLPSLDRHWRAIMETSEPIEVPLAMSPGAAPAWQARDMLMPETLDGSERLRRIYRWAALGAGGAGYIAYQSASQANLYDRAPHLVAPWVPLRGDDLGTLGIATKGAMAADLGLRLAGAPGLVTPAIGLSESEAPIPDTVITLNTETGRMLIDTTRISEPAADILAARLQEALAGYVAGPFDVDLNLLDAWQGPEVSLADALTIHRAVAAQAARTPDATALIFEDAALSYAALEARADAVAAMLRGNGAEQGAHVALCAARGPDMVIGALGILKAGAAYVPLDPEYPAARLAHAVADSAATLILTEVALEPMLIDALPDGSIPRLRIEDAPTDHAPVTDSATLDDTAYLIYTSGSTGTPKGVSVSHRNVANFRAGMKAHVTAEPGDVWLAVTSLAFDISVLELFHTLSQGATVVLSGGETRAAVSGSSRIDGAGGMQFGLYYWGNDGGSDAGKYHLLLEGAKFADANGFSSLWTPERHFHAFGGAYPNPSVTGAAVAAVTHNLDIRAGSCVAPLHHPARIAEEWAVIDNITGGRAGIAFASGWQPDDFVLRPENTPPANKPALYQTLEQVRALWRGEEVAFPTASGAPHRVATYPRPVQSDLPVWITTAGNPDTWREAGEMGAHVLTHLLGQTIEEVEGKIAIYHAALRGAGHDPADFQVTMLLHTYLAETRDAAREVARGPMKDYLRSAAGLIKQYAWAFPAFKKPKGVDNPMQIDLAGLAPDEMEAILDFAFERYFEDAGLFGTVEDGLARSAQLAEIGVTEIACLIDYGIEAETVLAGLRPLAETRRRATTPATLDSDDYSLAAQILRHGVTHLQCTPSMARLLAMNPEARRALGRLEHLYLGGEALPADLVADLRRATRARIVNMYGPTETTIWSTVQPLGAQVSGTAPIGAPIANTFCHVLSETGEVQPIGLPGNLWIGGEGVAKGYWQRPDLTAERFRARPGLKGGTLYDTGDLAAWRADGTLSYLGRADGQVKIRGHRIELGEIEARIAAHPGITGAVVSAVGEGADIRLVAHVTATGPVNVAALDADLARHLPAAMRPAQIERVAAFPLTPNKKIDRAALRRMPEAPKAAPAPEPQAMTARPQTKAPAASVPRDLAAQLAAIWAKVLVVERVSSSDNFFQLGGHSLLAVQMHRDIRAALPDIQLTITDVFRFPVLADLAAHLGGGQSADTAQSKPVAEGRSALMERRRAMRAARASGTR
ncbi:natural product biosynthesis luciferase-like monooxygenase domain-containing protein [Roseovarius nanhaiticus]|uniref:Natural product biosynthesis luciferase-like monooxygenase domain-containing protein n=1 Tax=Roseovarius nanhaiticus TaxID=573024 RepID=A0A1N7HII9_9RHOB|nr:MupA/Atu3671 family FMN-dependent luciferase-like monooxygenase [Roseovarius nanhaiticus]SEK91703.1 natural product biosynthesis luciferase-like monooxygenase domain-containing protein [Roseovarius nanhaiticus]SIS24715.1 natural product biosynthesis luciferase-like monooxygenase domain-containing protein [Roseovarius nanhaiticus]